MTITKTKIWTYEDYYHLDDDKRYEVIEGELIEMPSPRTIHQKISVNLTIELGIYLRKYKIGEIYTAPCDVILSTINTCQPDLIFISTENKGIIDDKGIFGSPDLVIEILSPSNANHDKVRKFKIYEKFKIKELWIIDPEEKSIDIFILEKEQFTSFCQAKNNNKIQSKIFMDIDLSYEDLIK